ncbi:hypothetical protein GRI97_01810 [Altererythrobacter xixiisoli]|uniref:Uncharacterized protein n=1 Tax=Croceibacterium xixiisoli TaxID=1476466 RepID=A0A6I4TTU8_9SPHN|nr:hypothetical protein [Croceibacterium xixiisoli]
MLAVLPLAACGSSEPEPANLEPDIEDISGGEMVVTEETPAVPVDLPETPMTPAPDAAPDASASATTAP